MKIQRYKQSAVESCLAACLLQLRYFYSNKKINHNLERKMLFYAFVYNREDFVAGHLDFIYKKFKFKSKRYAGNKILSNWAKKASGCKKILHKIDIDFLDSILQEKPLILLIDFFVLRKWCHTPHWIVIYKKEDKDYLVYEPWSGKQIWVKKDIIKKGIKILYTKLWMAPQVIILD